MENNSKKFISEFRVMGTDVSVEIIDGGSSAEKALEKIKEIFAENEKIFSRFRKDSELSKINDSIGKEIIVSEKMFEVLELCLQFNKISDGYFDPRIIENLEKIGYDKDFKTNDLNSEDFKEIRLEKIKGELADDLILDLNKKTVIAKVRIDTTGIAKGYAVDEAAQYLKNQGFENFIVDAGGDMFAWGKNIDNVDWTIGVEGIEDNETVLKLNNEGIATSGISRKRWKIGNKKVHHLINPKDPENFSYDIKTVTVTEEKTVEADGRAKVLVLMGKEKGLEFANKNNTKALFLDYRGNVYLSQSIKNQLI